MWVETGEDLHNALQKAKSNWFYVINGSWYGKRITQPQFGPDIIVVESYDDWECVNTIVLNKNTVVNWDITFDCKYGCTKKQREEYPIQLLEQALKMLKGEKK